MPCSRKKIMHTKTVKTWLSELKDWNIFWKSSARAVLTRLLPSWGYQACFDAGLPVTIHELKNEINRTQIEYADR